MGLCHYLAILLCFFGQLDLPFFATTIWSPRSPLSSLSGDDLADFIEIWRHQRKSSSAFHYQTYKPINTCTNFLLSLSFILDAPSPMASSCQCFRNHPLSLSQEYYTHVLLYFLLHIQSSLLLYISNYHSFSSHPCVYAPLATRFSKSLSWTSVIY